jgi:hypothetical protein
MIRLWIPASNNFYRSHTLFCFIALCHLMRSLKLITRFYTGIFLANFLVTLSCIYLLRHFGHSAQKIIGVLFWYKIITIAGLFYTSVYYRKNEMYYYQNLSVSKLQLGVVTSLFDFSVWVVLMMIQLMLGIPAFIFNLSLGSVLLIYLYLYSRE